MIEPVDPNVRAHRAELLKPVGRWTHGAKARLVAGILDGVITIREACILHRMAEEELLELQRAFTFSGQRILRPIPREARPAATPWPFGDLPMFGYDLVMVDLPVETRMRSPKGEKKNSAAHYGAMSWEACAAMPIGQLASRDCVFFVWTTWPHLLYGGNPDFKYVDADASRSRIGECLRAWGLRYVTGGAWRKTTAHGKTAFGTGYRARSACEPFLLAITGNPDTSRAERNLIDGLRREHSRKPDNAYAWCERYLPGARRLDLFSRQSRPGWDSWGFEAGKFDPVVTRDATEGVAT